MPTDEQLLLLIQDGDDAALEQLVDRYYGPIYAYLSRMLMDTRLAEDLTQECFLKVCAAVRDNRLPASFRPWLFRIAGNLCRDYWRKASTRLERTTETHLLSGLPSKDSVASLAETRWEREQIVRLLGHLNEGDRQMIVLRFYHDWKLGDIADVMELPLSTVKTRFYKTLDRLAGWMQAEEGMRNAK